MGIGDALRMMLAFDISGNLIHWARAVQGNASDDIFKIFGLKLAHKIDHAAAFKLKNPQRVPPGEHAVDGFVRQIQMIDIDPLPRRAGDVVHGVADDRQRPKSQKVHFNETEIFKLGHGILGDDGVVIAIEGHVFGQRLISDDHPGGMG